MSAVPADIADRPEELADWIVTEYGDNPAWLDRFAAALDRRRSARSLFRILAVWDLSPADAARLFGVSHHAIGEWTVGGVPSERTAAVSDLAAVTDLLVHYVQRDRIPAVVRQPIANAGGRSVLQLAAADTAATLAAARDAFDFSRVRAWPDAGTAPAAGGARRERAGLPATSAAAPQG